MHRIPRRTLAPLALAAALSACVDHPPLDPAAPGAAAPPSALLTEALEARPGKHLVVFRGESGVPDRFAAEVAALGGSVDAAYPQIGVAVAAGLTGEAAAQLAASPGVLSVDASDLVPWGEVSGEPLDPAALQAQGGGDLTVSPLPAQPPVRASMQWNLAAIGAGRARAAGYLGSPDVTIAILDTGIDATLSDLQGRVDPARSTSFVPEEDAFMRQAFPAHPVWGDIAGHGTNVATQASSNGVLFAGVTARTRLMSVKVCTIVGCPRDAVLAGIVYAAENGADVINLSLNSAFTKRDCPGCNAAQNRAVAFALRSGATVVAAAGNQGSNRDHDRDFHAGICTVPGVLCVSATGPTSSGPFLFPPYTDVDAPATYSNYGRSAVHVAAPGGNLTPLGESRVFAGCSRTMLIFQPGRGVFPTTCSTFTHVEIIFGWRGTSQAAPHVSGLAALLVERYGRNPHRIATAIQQSADDLGEPGMDERYGHGRINVARALGL